MSHWLIVAGSARPLAQACVDAGMSCDVIDPWGDADTRALARRHARAAIGEDGFETALSGLIGRMRREHGWDGIIAGSGFEARPDALTALAAFAPVLGNDAATVARCKDPRAVAEAARAAGLRSPDIRLHDGPDAIPDSGWLVKPLGGCGGLGIRHARTGEAVPAGHYGQRCVAGQPASVLFLADGRQARIVGVSRQTPGSLAGPYAWCEATGDLPCDRSVSARLERSLDRLSAAFGLRGLNGIDLVMDADGEPVLIEINPRPTATMMLYGHRVAGGLFAAHIAACRGRLTDVNPVAGAVKGLRVVYAPLDMTVGDDMRWPRWCGDRPAAGSVVPRAAPLCTVHAEAGDGAAASRLLKQREGKVLDMFGVHPDTGQMMTTVFS